MKVIITGGTGYIGSHTAMEMLGANYEVVLIDNFSNSYPWVAERIATLSGKQVLMEEVDLTDADALDVCLARHNDAAAIIHFAALKAVGESVEMPLRYYRNNLIGLLNLLSSMIRHSIPDLVFSSSCTVYGAAENMPIDETAPLLAPLSPYGATKRMAEEMITDLASANRIRAVLLRYFNPVGAHHSAQLGELPIGVPNNLMPFITQTAIGKRKKLMVFGNDYPTPDGTPIRDYIHVTDLAIAHLKALQRMLNGKQKKSSEVFNLGTGKGYSVLEMIHAFEKHNGVKVPYEITDRRPGDIAEIWADTSLANKELRWHAQYGLKEMVTTAWQWEQHLQTEENLNPEEVSK